MSIKDNSNSSIFNDAGNSTSSDSDSSYVLRHLNKLEDHSVSPYYRTGPVFRESYIDQNGNARPFSIYSDSPASVELPETQSVRSDMSVMESRSILSEKNTNLMTGKASRPTSLKVFKLSRNSSIKKSSRKPNKKSSEHSLVPPVSSRNNSFDGYSYTLPSSPRTDTSFSSSKHSVKSPQRNVDLEPENLKTIHLVDQIRRFEATGNTAPDEIREDENPIISKINPRNNNLITGSSWNSSNHATTISMVSSPKLPRGLAQSVPNFELSRKRSPGLPPMLLIKDNSAVSLKSQQSKRGAAIKGLGFNVIGIVPSINSTGSESGPGDDMQIVNLKSHENVDDVDSLMDENLCQLKVKDFGSSDYSLTSTITENAVLEMYIDSHDSHDFEPGDELLEKVYCLRKNNMSNRWTPRRTKNLAWILYLLSFLLPPLFFFLGFGIIDEYIGLTSLLFKRISLATGIFVLLVALACIGVGFGVGINTA